MEKPQQKPQQINKHMTSPPTFFQMPDVATRTESARDHKDLCPAGELQLDRIPVALGPLAYLNCGH